MEESLTSRKNWCHWISVHSDWGNPKNEYYYLQILKVGEA